MVLHTSLFRSLPTERLTPEPDLTLPEKLIITQGSRGVITCLKNGEILSVPARKENVADTTGAGDTLNGAFALQRAKGADMETALRYANVAASLSTEKFGAQSGMPMAQEVEEELEKLGGRA